MIRFEIFQSVEELLEIASHFCDDILLDIEFIYKPK